MIARALPPARRQEHRPARARPVAVFAACSASSAGGSPMLALVPDEPRRRCAAPPAARSRPRAPTSSTATARCWRPTCKVVSVFAEPRKIVDKDEAVELLTAVLPDLDARELRQKLGGSRKGFVWVKREITPRQQAEVHRLGIPGVGFLPENKRVYPNGIAGAHVLGFANIDNVGIAGIEKYIDGQGLQDLNGAGFAVERRGPEAGPALARPARPARAARRARQGHGEVQGQGRRRRHHGRQHRRDDRPRLAARLRPEQPGRRAREGPHQPHQCRRLRDGLDLQGADHRDGARFGQVQHQLVLRRPRRRCATAGSRSTTTTPSTGS